MFDFEIFDPQLGPLQVSVAEYGLLFSKAAIDAIGRPERIRLGFNKENRLIGVIPANLDDDKSIVFKEKEKNGYIRINSKEFIRFVDRQLSPDDSLNISSKAVRYHTYWDSDSNALVVDLKKPLDKNETLHNEATEE